MILPRFSSLARWGTLLLLLAGASACQKRPVVVVYTSQDQVYAEPILQSFSRSTGIQVRPLYDSEATKTVGLVNRLLSEAQHPRCDLFWNNEELRTRQLAARGILQTENGLRAFGFRKRQLVVNTNLLAPAKWPASLKELTRPEWKGKVSLAYPLFGSTSTHFLALRQRWGVPQWQAWCRGLQQNAARLVDGNSVVVKLVARGEALVGLTDSDDVRAGQRNGLPIAGIDLPEEEQFWIRNSIGLIRGSPHPANARQLADYLQSAAVVNELIRLGALDGEGRDPQVDWEALLAGQQEALSELKQIFLR